MSQKTKTKFQNISPKTWEHPADRAALNALRQLPGFDQVTKFLFGNTTERAIRLFYLGGAVRANENQFKRVHTLLHQACEILDVDKIPEIYVSQNPQLNAMAVGLDSAFIVLHSSLVKTMDDEELLAVIAHEVGHIVSGHVLYKTILRVLLDLSKMVLPFNIPFSEVIIMGLIYALLEWDRKSELSSDRAGLLATQSVEVSQRVLMKLAGGSEVEHMNLDEFVAQAEEYEKGGDVIDGVFKALLVVNQTHPFPVLRVAALKKWVDSGDYQKIMDGEFIKRDSEEKEDIQKDFQAAADEYKKDFETSEDPLAKVLQNAGEDIGKGLKDAAKQADDFFKNLFNSGDK